MRKNHALMHSAVPLIMLGLSTAVAMARSVGNPDCRQKQYSTNLVLEVATALKGAGFLKGKASGELSRDGKPPAATARAIETYRLSKGLPKSGEIDLQLLQSLLGSRYPLAGAQELSEVCDELAGRGADAGDDP
jgi:hypothetical protein